MGLFDRFKKNTASGSAASGAADYSNMRVEVMTAHGHLLFAALLLNYRGSSAELRQLSGRSFPKNAEPLPVRIRGYHREGKKAIYWDGVISRLSEDTWQASHLSIRKAENDRSAFRLDLDLDATVTRTSGLRVGGSPCKLLNLSAGGVRIANEQLYQEGERLMLILQLPEARELSALTCQVVRALGKRNGLYEYGCKFLNLSEADEGKLTHTIFALQRKMRMTSV